MQRIPTKIWSHLSERDAGAKHFVTEVLTSEPKPVRSFRALVKEIANISYHNPELVLFYRGQEKDYKKSYKGLAGSSFYPTIYRKSGGSLSDQELADRFNRLDFFSAALITEFEQEKLIGRDKLSKFPELAWAILQHYEVCGTPLLDVTHSLRESPRNP